MCIHTQRMVENNIVSCGHACSGGPLPTAAGAVPCPSMRRLGLVVTALCGPHCPGDAEVPCLMNIYDSYLPGTSGDRFDLRVMQICKGSVPSQECFLPCPLMTFKTIMEITDGEFYFLMF